MPILIYFFTYICLWFATKIRNCNWNFYKKKLGLGKSPNIMFGIMFMYWSNLFKCYLNKLGLNTEMYSIFYIKMNRYTNFGLKRLSSDIRYQEYRNIEKHFYPTTFLTWKIFQKPIGIVTSEKWGAFWPKEGAGMPGLVKRPTNGSILKKNFQIHIGR